MANMKVKKKIEQCFQNSEGNISSTELHISAKNQINSGIKELPDMQYLKM